ncbi:hypothetical protein [Ensifer soli]
MQIVVFMAILIARRRYAVKAVRDEAASAITDAFRAAKHVISANA